MRCTIVVLLMLLLSPALAAEPYDRSLYRHWIDANGDCQDTREEVLIAERLVVAQLEERGWTVISALWIDPYTGTVMTDRQQIDIDHLVPLGEAHASGADIWDEERRQAYANDRGEPDSLVAVLAGANRSKGDRDPAHWMPPNRAFWCDYIERWMRVKLRWQLSLDEAEGAAVKRGRAECAKYRVGDSLGGR